MRWWFATSVVLVVACAAQAPSRPEPDAGLPDAGLPDAGSQDAGAPDAGHQASAYLKSCAAMQQAPYPRTLLEMTRHLNGLPRPVNAACIVASMARPISVVATFSQESAQPAANKKSPRIFLLTASLALSVVPEGSGAKLFELSEFITPLTSMKGELELPITTEVSDDAALKHVLNPGGFSTTCGLCHRGEGRHEPVDAGFVSLAFRPNPGTEMSISALQVEHQACIASGDPSERCELFHALFDVGAIRQGAFSRDLALFLP